MSREIKKKNNFKYHKKKFACMELVLDGLIEIAPSLSGSDKFDWKNKEMVKFSADEKMKIINFIQKNERKFIADDKLEPLPHMESSQPKTIYINTQVYKDKSQLRIVVQPPKDSGRKQLSMSLDWYQVLGYKMWLEESLRQDIRGRLEDTVEAYAYLKGVGEDNEKVIRRIPKHMNKGDLYKWDEILIVECTGKLYDPFGCIWTYCFEVFKKKKDKVEDKEELPNTDVETEPVKSVVSARNYLLKLNELHRETVFRCLNHYGKASLELLTVNEVNSVISKVEKVAARERI